MRPLRTAIAIFVLLLPWVAGAGQSAIMLLYQRQEAGQEPYPTRLLITPAFMRMDDGEDEGDFVLFDRQRRTLYSVTHGERTVFEIPPRPVVVESPIALQLEATEQAVGAGTPKVAGRTPQHHRLYANSKLCYEVVSVPGLLEDAVAALREFRQVLAGEHARNLVNVPADLHEACDLATHTFAPDRHLRYGLPIQEWDNRGFSRVLLDYAPEQPVGAELFRLPEGYRHYGGERLKR